MTLATNIGHMSGIAEKVIRVRGQRSTVKVMTLPNAIKAETYISTVWR